MIENIIDIATWVDGILWGPWTMVLIAFVSIFLTVRSGFFQVRKFPFMLKNSFGNMFTKARKEKKGRMTPFQATTTALASTVGMGNIAGVATAISIGGPGAMFWMWVMAFLGMMSKAAEIALAVHYRESGKNGRLHGGPMYYIKKGLGWNSLAYLFSIGVFINAVLGAAILQPHTVGRAFLSSYGLNPYIVTGVMAVITGFVVIGGIKRIGQFCEKLVPLMSILYITGGLVIFIINYEKIPEVFGTIFKYAFAPMPAVGGIAGASLAAAIKNGVTKGMLSNEAGLGTAPMAHAMADTEHPFQQGLWGAFEVFIDTIIICTISAFTILSTGVLSSANGTSGVELVINAFATVFSPQIAGALVSFCILTFCLTTQIGYFVYYETSIVNIFGQKSIRVFKWLYLVPGIIFAGFADVDKIWVFANICVGGCAVPNLIAVLALSGVVFKLMKDYLQGKNEYSTAIVDVTGKYIKQYNKRE